jgi:DNA-binding response OmpR family regulator
MDPKTTILLIEDDPAVARSLIDGLEREGFATLWKATGKDGVEIAARGLAHLILLDVRLPDGSGFDFCRQMRQMGLHQPVLMLTVQSDETDKVLGLEMGADDYITKPFSLRELISRIRAHLRRAYGELSNSGKGQLLINDLLIDPARAQVLRGDTPINLTPTEYRLLLYLAQHRGQALTRTQIVEAIWDHAADLESERAVNVHIRRLREKIEFDPARPTCILTVPGIGYRLT